MNLDNTHLDASVSQEVTDPVCGMAVDTKSARYMTVHDGERIHFCSSHCQSRFLADPERFLTPSSPTPADTGRGGYYDCPMHPEVRQAGPGSCPKCGMALGLEIMAPAQAPNPELAKMSLRFWIALALTLPVFALEMSGHIVGSMFGPQRVTNLIQLALSAPVVLWAGAPFFVKGWASLKSRHLNMFSLIALGIGVAWGYSVAAVLVPDAFPQAAHIGHSNVPVYFESAAVITTLVLLGQLLELRARDQASDSIRGLLDLASKFARRVLSDGTDEDIALELVAVGDKLRLRPGEKIPVDGVIVDGSGMIDESFVTGEALPVSKTKGDSIVAGSINTTSSFIMRAEKVGADTMLARIVQVVADAQKSRAPIQRTADTLSSWFVPAVIAVALGSALAWLGFGTESQWQFALLSEISVLIVACPCALGLATPMSIMVGVGRGARAGILVRDAEALERLGKVDTLVIDKTGTLTEGHPQVAAIMPATGIDLNELLKLAASAEQGSEHPFAYAIIREAEERGLALSKVTGFKSPTGKGVLAKVGNRKLVLGNGAFLREQQVNADELETDAKPLRQTGATAIFVGIDGKPGGIIAISDPVKPTSAAAIAALKKAGIAIVMLTGDNETTAQSVAKQLGIDDCRAEVLPEQKAQIVKSLQEQSKIVAMAGDGINDAPALATADVGIAMGGGTDIAIENAGITLLNGDITDIMRARRLSQAVMRNIRQNLFFAFAYNVIGIPIAAGALYPAFGLLLSPVIAAAAMSLSSVSVVGNALRLKGLRL